jgi:hypothetical protein
LPEANDGRSNIEYCRLKIEKPGRNEERENRKEEIEKRVPFWGDPAVSSFLISNF